MRMLYTLLIGLMLIAMPDRAMAQQDPMALAEGARVWANNCTRCHNARSSMERNDREWVTIVAHMRARANLTRSEARAVATFLKATNAPEYAPTPDMPQPASQQPTQTEGTANGSKSQALNDTTDTRLSAREVASILLLIRMLE